MTTRGRFITFEGGEGAGKSTQVRLLCDRLASAGIASRATREPGGSPGGDEIRELLVRGAIERWEPMTEMLLHFAARHEHVSRLIQPALAAGEWVVCDRFADSTMAYQGYGHELGREAVAAVQEVVLGTFAPDLTLILDLPVDEGLARAGRREGRGAGRRKEDRYERMDRDFHARVREGFLEIARREPGRCLVIDGTAAPAAVHAEVCGAISARLGLQLGVPGA